MIEINHTATNVTITEIKNTIQKTIPQQINLAKKTVDYREIQEKLKKTTEKLLAPPPEPTPIKREFNIILLIVRIATFTLIIFTVISSGANLIVAIIDRAVSKNASDCGDVEWARWTKMGLDIVSTIGGIGAGFAQIWRDNSINKAFGLQDQLQETKDKEEQELQLTRNELVKDANDLQSLFFFMMLLNNEKDTAQKVNYLTQTYTTYETISSEIKVNLPPEDFIPNQIVNNLPTDHPLFMSIAKLNEVKSQVASQETKPIEPKKDEQIKKNPQDKLTGEQSSSEPLLDLKDKNLTVYTENTKKVAIKDVDNAVNDLCKQLLVVGWKQPLDKFLFNGHYIVPAELKQKLK